MTIDEKTFTDRIHAGLTASTHEIDAETQQRLYAIRRKALQQKPQQGWLQKLWQNNMVWAPVAGVAFCSVMAIMFILPAQQASAPVTISGDYTAMFEVVDSPDDLDAVTDPDFYLWLDEVNPEDTKHSQLKIPRVA
jgi:hypothetical protein